MHITHFHLRFDLFMTTLYTFLRLVINRIVDIMPTMINVVRIIFFDMSVECSHPVLCGDEVILGKYALDAHIESGLMVLLDAPPEVGVCHASFD